MISSSCWQESINTSVYDDMIGVKTIQTSPLDLSRVHEAKSLSWTSYG
jgi:hypothetical protein